MTGQGSTGSGSRPSGPAVAGLSAGLARIVALADLRLGGLSNGALRVEDGLLVGWLLVGAPIGRLIGGPATGDGLSGSIWVGSVVLAVVVVATRSPGDPSIGFDGPMTPRSYAPLPFLLSLSIVANQGMERLGLERDWVVGVVFLVTMASYLLSPHLPSLPRTIRRLLIVPFLLIAGTVFGGMVSDMAGLFDFRPLLGDPGTTPSAFLGLLGLEVLFSGFFYLAFVFAPRMVAEAEGSWPIWFVRYGAFLGATIASVTFLGAGAS